MSRLELNSVKSDSVVAEADIYAIMQAGREGLCARQLLYDLGWAWALVEMRSGVTAASGTIGRRGRAL